MFFKAFGELLLFRLIRKWNEGYWDVKRKEHEQCSSSSASKQNRMYQAYRDFNTEDEAVLKRHLKPSFDTSGFQCGTHAPVLLLGVGRWAACLAARCALLLLCWMIIII